MLNVHRSRYYNKNKRDDREVIDAIREKAEHSKDGFWKIYCRLRIDGYSWNHKRAYRVYKLMNLNYRRKLKRRLLIREKEALFTPNGKNISCSMDFVSYMLTNGRRFRVLNIINDFNRENVAMEIGNSMPAERVIRIMEKVTWCYGKPESIRVDNGPEFIADKLNQGAIKTESRLNIHSRENQLSIASLNDLIAVTERASLTHIFLTTSIR